MSLFITNDKNRHERAIELAINAHNAGIAIDFFSLVYQIYDYLLLDAEDKSEDTNEEGRV